MEALSSLIKSTVDFATTPIDNLVSKIESLEMDASIINQDYVPIVTPYKFHEIISPDSAFFLKEPNECQSEDSE